MNHLRTLDVKEVNNFSQIMERNQQQGPTNLLLSSNIGGMQVEQINLMAKAFMSLLIRLMQLEQAFAMVKDRRIFLSERH